jgi:hypothetical protein
MFRELKLPVDRSREIVGNIQLSFQLDSGSHLPGTSNIQN